MNDNSNTTIKNFQDEAEIVAIHDTTFINPKSKELGRRGIGSHLTLAASSGINPQVFGTLNISFIIRDKDGKN